MSQDFLARHDFSRIASEVARCTYPGLTLSCVQDGQLAKVRVESEDLTGNVTGRPTYQVGRWWLLSRWMTSGEIAQTCLMAVLSWNEHEAREQFKVDGVDVFNPHYDLDQLVALRETPGAIKERPDAR